MTIHSFHLDDQAREKRIKSQFARLWSHFASDFLDEAQSAEYNTIKHGLRSLPGGCMLAVGEEDTPGVAAPPERMQRMGGSEFGSTIFVPEFVGGSKTHFRVRRTSRNWHPENFVHGLALIAASLGNILAFLRLVNGVAPQEVRFSWPRDEEYFEAPWRRSVGVISLGLDTVVEPGHTIPLNRTQILHVYQASSGSPSTGSEESV